MRIFCPYCSAEHAVDANQIPLVGMDFHCPQCGRSFNVSADGEVEARDDGASDSDPLAVDFDLEAELDLASATEEEIMAASFDDASPGPPPLPLSDGDPGDMPTAVVSELDIAELVPDESLTVPPRPAPAMEEQARPVAPSPPPSGGSDRGLSDQDLALIGSYHKTSERLTQAQDAVWIPDDPFRSGEQPPGAGTALGSASPSPPPEPQPVAPTPPPRAQEEPVVKEPEIGLDDTFEITSMMESPSSAAPGAAPASSPGADASWEMPDLDFGSDPFATGAAGAAAQPSDGAANGADLIDELFADSSAGGDGVEQQPSTGHTSESSDLDALFDLDLEIGGAAASSAMPGGLDEPRGGGAPTAMMSGGPAPSSETSQPLLEEMDFSSLLQEEGVSEEGSIFDVEPSGVFDGAAAVGGADAGAPAADPSVSSGEQVFDADAIFDLDVGGEPQVGAPSMEGPPMGGAGGAGSVGVGLDMDGESIQPSDGAFKPAKMPAGRKARSRGMNKGLQYAVLGALLFVGIGVAMGQVDGVGYFGIDILFPEEKKPQPRVTKPKPVRSQNDAAKLQDDTVAAYQDAISRLEKELELHPADEGVKVGLAKALAGFGSRFPEEFRHNKKYQRTLDKLVSEVTIPDGTFEARMRLLKDDAKAARELLDRFGRRPSDSPELQREYELLYGQVEMRLGDPKAALPHFQKALDFDADNVASLYQLGRCYWLLGKLLDARHSFEAVLQKSKNHDSARIGLAELMAEMGEGAKALEIATAILDEARARKLTEQAFAAHRLLARIYAQIGKPEEQRKHLEEALSIKPLDEQLLLQLVSFLKGGGNIEEATGRLETCLGKGCESAEFYRALSELYLKSGDIDRALRTLRTGLKIHPKEVSLYLLQGEAFLSRNEAVAARQSFRKGVEADPGNVSAWERLADILLHGEQYEEATKVLEKGVKSVASPESLMERLARVYDKQGKRGDAQRILGELVEKDPLNFKARLELAQLLKRSGLIAEALSHFEYLYRNNQMQREVRVAYADTLRVARRYDQAERELRQVVRIDPSDMAAKVLLGAVLAEQKKYDEAETLLSEVVEKDPQNAMALFYLGKLELARDNVKKALGFLAQAIRSPDATSEYRFEYAETLYKMGGRKKLKLADNAYTGIVTAYESKGKGTAGFERITDVYLHRGQVRLDLKLYDKALKDFEKAMELNSLRADTVTAFASGLVKKKRYGDAEKYLKVVLQENERFAPAHYQLGVVLYQLGKPLKAKKEFLKALQEDDTSFPLAQRFLGYIYREQHLDREARKYFRRYLELAPEDAADRADIERLIGKR